jgi:carbon monoxide dehydrogenase subunit G
MTGHSVLVERSQAVAAPVGQVWPLLSGPEAMALRPGSFAFDVAAPSAARLRTVLSVPGARPIFVTYQVIEEVPGQVVSLTLPGKPADGGEVFTLSAVPERTGSRMSLQVRSVVANRNAQVVVDDYWQRTLRVWLAGLCEVAEGRAPLPDGGMPAGLQAACTPAALKGRPASESASALIAAPAEDVWKAVNAPEWAAILMSRGGPVHAGIIPGTPLRQVGEMQYFITHRDNGELRNTVTMLKEFSARRFALITPVGQPGPEMLHQVAPDGQGTRLDLTFRWPASIPDRQATARSIGNAVRHRVAAFKDLIENPDSPWASRRANSAYP